MPEYKKWSEMTLQEKFEKKGVRFIQCPNCGKTWMGKWLAGIVFCGACKVNVENLTNTKIAISGNEKRRTKDSIVK